MNYWCVLISCALSSFQVPSLFLMVTGCALDTDGNLKSASDIEFFNSETETHPIRNHMKNVEPEKGGGLYTPPPTLADSGGFRQTPVDSGGLRQTQALDCVGVTWANFICPVHRSPWSLVDSAGFHQSPPGLSPAESTRLHRLQQNPVDSMDFGRP